MLRAGNYEVPSWRALADGARPPEDNELGTTWQQEAAIRVEQQFREQQLFLVLSESERTLLRSQSGRARSRFSVPPTANPAVRFDSQIFECFCCVPSSPLVQRFCQCGRHIDEFGRHRAVCAQAGVLGRGFALESVAARACREGGARDTTNMFVRDLDVDVPNTERRSTHGSRGRRTPSVRRHSIGL